MARAVNPRFLGLALVALGAPACATLADSGGGDQNLPNAAAGPFRELKKEELPDDRTAPYVLRDDDDYPRDVSLVDADGDPATLAAVAYVAHTTEPAEGDPDPAAPPDEIIRLSSADGRSFGRFFDVVLAPELPWEGGTVGAPAALRVSGEIWLYYAAAGGIGLGTSADGLSFTRSAEPVLAPSGGGWEQGAPVTSPAVIQLPDGGFRMLYQVGDSIGEAESTDGRSFSRLGTEPSLTPRPPSDDPDERIYDTESVGAPMAVMFTSAEGRDILRLYYAAVDGEQRRTVAMAARFGVEGPWKRAASPVFGAGGSLGPTEPWVMRYPDFSLLFATMRAGSSPAQDYPAVAAGVAPATVTLPPPVSP